MYDRSLHRVNSPGINDQLRLNVLLPDITQYITRNAEKGLHGFLAYLSVH